MDTLGGLEIALVAHGTACAHQGLADVAAHPGYVTTLLRGIRHRQTRGLGCRNGGASGEQVEGRIEAVAGDGQSHSRT